MNTAQSRTERNHVKVRILLREQSAFQTSMDAQYTRILSEEFLVCLYCDGSELTVSPHLPCGISQVIMVCSGRCLTNAIKLRFGCFPGVVFIWHILAG